ncbi:MAG: ATP-dependent 6-phosphofructokinase [bacterium]
MKIGILTGGGDCPGLNAAMRGIVLKAADYGYEVIGIQEGWKGLIEGDSRPLTIADVDEIIGKGGTILGTSRTNPLKREDGVEIVKENFEKLGLDALVAIGGNDTLAVAAEIDKQGIKIVGIPKTMDNDLSCTDYTFGFDTSVTIAVDALERLQDTGRSHRRIMVLEVMGRDAGWVALFTGIAGGADWILIPEEPVDFEEMCQHLNQVYKRKHYALVVVSEGIKIEKETIKSLDERDEFGHPIHRERGVGQIVANEIENRTKHPTRVAVIGHIQRGGTPTLFDRMLGTRVGVKAVELIANGEFGKMACLIGNEIKAVPLTDAVAELKTVTKDWWQLAKGLFK